MTSPNPPCDTEIRPYGTAAIEAAARIVLNGWPVAVPTETVYGLAADATSDEAVRRIYEAKGRPSFNPLIVHVRDIDHARQFGRLSEAAVSLANAFWPGPLTLVVPIEANCGISDLVTAGLGTIALRCPKHPAMRDLLAATGRPLAAPSANASGAISPTDAEHVLKTLSGRIPLVIDAGASEKGLESTIVRVAAGPIAILRPGPISFQDISAVAKLSISPATGKIEAPGQLASHYAPSKPLRLNAASAAKDEWMIGFGEIPGNANLSPSGDLTQAAARLFGLLHQAETSTYQRIAVAPVPQDGIGVAINDRLSRAAAPR